MHNVVKGKLLAIFSNFGAKSLCFFSNVSNISLERNKKSSRFKNTCYDSYFVG